MEELLHSVLSGRYFPMYTFSNFCFDTDLDKGISLLFAIRVHCIELVLAGQGFKS